MRSRVPRISLLIGRAGRQDFSHTSVAPGPSPQEPKNRIVYFLFQVFAPIIETHVHRRKFVASGNKTAARIASFEPMRRVHDGQDRAG
jgi:hypothetical protein